MTFDVVITCQGTVFTQNILGTLLVWTVVTIGVSHDMSHDANQERAKNTDQALIYMDAWWDRLLNSAHICENNLGAHFFSSENQIIS